MPADVARQMVEGGWAMASTTGSAIYLPDEAAISGSGAFRCPIAILRVWRFSTFGGLRDQG